MQDPNQATKNLGAIPFRTIIGAPLQAAVEAQALAAKTSYEFIENVGFNESVNEKDGTVTREAVNVGFNYVRGGQVVTLNVPLLTILPVPYFEIKDMDIAFKAKISAEANTKETESSSSSKQGDGKSKLSLGWSWWGVNNTTSFNASYSSKKDSSATKTSKYSVEYTMDIGVKAGQGDMPAGLATVLNILQDSIQEVTSPLSVSLLSSSQLVKLADDISLYVLYEGNVMTKESSKKIYVKVVNGDDLNVKVETASPAKIGDNDLLKLKLGKKDESGVVKPGRVKFLIALNSEFRDAVPFEVELTTTTT